ncbi:MAG: triose-phosphate isomerase [Anaerolineae bacterium]|nr:triose-phosphate isomerase [Anaerolineae bacterium]
MRTPIIAGNWKMNKTIAEATALAQELRAGLAGLAGVEKVLCPAFPALAAVGDAIRSTDIGLGAQNRHWEEKGAFTGEVSPLMLQGLCRYVILGHSERRQYFGETDEGVNRKVKAALAHDLVPIVCVGETLAENEAGRTAEVVGRQVRNGLAGFTPQQIAGLVIAYEPVWAIGTGRAATGAGGGAVIGLTIRGALAEMYGGATAQAVRVQYGGSTTAANIAEFMAQPDIDGALVGGASLKASEFIQIVRVAAEMRR